MKLLKKLKKKFPVRSYKCDVYDDTFYFKHRTVAIDEQMDAAADLYGGQNTSDFTIAVYLLMSCDSKGVQEYPDISIVSDIQPAIDELRHEDGFNAHVVPAFNFAVGSQLYQDEDVVADTEGTLDHEKKQS